MVPEWKGPFENWSRKFVRRNQWKVAHILGGYEDCLQECGMMFAICCDRYGDKVDTPQWMMSLFKTAVNNHWLWLSAKDTQQREIKIDPDDDIVYPPTNISSMLGAASEAVQTVLTTINTAPTEIVRMLLPEEPVGVKVLNRRWRRILNLPEDSYPASELHQLITGKVPIPRIAKREWDEETKEHVQLLLGLDIPMWAIIRLLSLDKELVADGNRSENVT